MKNRNAPIFSYVSVCCNELASKQPCVKVSKKDAVTNSLGSWNCNKCKQKCKVTRTKNTY